MFGQSLLEMFVQSLKHVHDPRSQHGVSQPFRTVLTITLLGLLANLSTLAEIERWTKLHLPQLQQFLRFRKKGVPHAGTMARILRKISLHEAQTAAE
ncbi:hypothetical protein AGMMS49587_20610 [Spirochaetia bacterium]|nr:hypothetical protein AGMMS49587_20610 [Spirochaetia bacterium]